MKSIPNKKKVNIISLILLTIAIGTLSIRIYSLKNKNVEFDDLTAQTSILKKHLNASIKIGFADIGTNDYIINQVGFAMLPTIVVNDANIDTVIMVQHKDKKFTAKANYKIIDRCKFNDGIDLLLAVKTK